MSENFKLLKTILLIVLFFFSYANARSNYEKSVVRISSTLSLYDYKNPWKDPARKNIVGTGVIIENHYILTNAHVVSNAKKIEIKKSNENKSYYAKIKYISHQADLALLEIYNKKFFKNTKALKISQDIKIGDKVIVAGYPLSDLRLSSKKGNIRKIKYESYSLSNEDLLALELNITLKEGNSGGPILNKNGQIIGLVMQMPKDSSSTAYAIPSFIINTFFTDIEDKKIDGFHSNSNSYQYLENKTLQNYYKIKEAGMLVTDIDAQEKQLKVDDIITKINGYKISNISKLKFFSQFHKKTVNQSIPLSILRNQKIIKIDYKLYNSNKLIAQEFNKKPRYFIFGGLVFTPITRNYLQSIGMKQYEMNMLFYEQKRTLQKEEPVAWMETKFPHEINKGYISKVEIVDKVNDIKVKSFSHFVKLIKDSKEKYILIEFIKKQSVLLKKDEAMRSFLEINDNQKNKEEKNVDKSFI